MALETASFAILTLTDGRKILARGLLKCDHPERPADAIDPTTIVSYERTSFTRWMDERGE